MALFLSSQDALKVMLVSQWVSESVSHTVEPSWLMWPWWVKIPTEDFPDKTLVINDTYRGDVREIVVLIMALDKVVNEVTDMEIDK